MTSEGDGRVFSSGKANTLFVSIPADVAVDSAFPFEDNQDVRIRIDGESLVVESAED